LSHLCLSLVSHISRPPKLSSPPDKFHDSRISEIQEEKTEKKIYSREFKLEAVRLITEKGYSIAKASLNLGVDYSLLRRWKKQLANDPVNAFSWQGKKLPMSN
jgi:hypothetical protein